MNNHKEAKNAPSVLLPKEQQRGIQAAKFLFNAATLCGAVVACAMAGAKVPPLLGD